jgi:hypothetical protein
MGNATTGGHAPASLAQQQRRGRMHADSVRASRCAGAAMHAAAAAVVAAATAHVCRVFGLAVRHHRLGAILACDHNLATNRLHVVLPGACVMGGKEEGKMIWSVQGG